MAKGVLDDYKASESRENHTSIADEVSINATAQSDTIAVPPHGLGERDTATRPDRLSRFGQVLIWAPFTLGGCVAGSSCGFGCRLRVWLGPLRVRLCLCCMSGGLFVRCLGRVAAWGSRARVGGGLRWVRLASCSLLFCS